MSIYYLYKKTHNKTGLKYLGQTRRDPYQYKGSGDWWKNHLKIHGEDITTEILRECVSKEELKQWGTYYSDLWNVVESKEWANLKAETGDGGCSNRSAETRAKISQAIKIKNAANPCSAETRAKLSKARKGVPRSAETVAKMIAGKKGCVYPPQSAETRAKRAASLVGKNKGKIRTAETIAKMSAAQKARWARQKAS